MAIVARLLPRHWDGRRLLQFLTGLALIALAFAVPALTGPADAPADPPVTIITTVDTPVAPGLPVTEAPARAGAAAAGLALGDTAGSATPTTTATGAGDAGAGAGSARAGARSVAGGVQSAERGPKGSGAVDAAAVQGVTGLPVRVRHGGWGICVQARVAGVTQRAHGQRAPPRA